jgi:hypothetical protein
MVHSRTDQEKVLIGVHRAWRAVRFAHGAEALLIALGTALLTLAAAGFEGIHPTERDVLIVSVVAGMASGLAWSLANRISPFRVADRVDRRMRCEGALVAAWEYAGRQEPMARLLAQRVVHRTSTRRWSTFAIPNSMPFIVAPLLGGILLAQSVPNLHDPRIGRGDPIELLRGFQAHLDRAKDAGLQAGVHADGSPQVDAETLRELMQSSKSGRSVTRDQSAMELWLEEASGLLPRLPEGSVAREEFEQAMAMGEAAALALDQPTDRSSPTRSDSPTGGESAEGVLTGAIEDNGALTSNHQDSDPGRGSGVSAVGVPGEDLASGSNPEVAGGAQDGTMSALIPPDGALGTDPTASFAGSERGLVERRWWSDRDASLVRRWVELQRQTSDSAPDDLLRD